MASDAPPNTPVGMIQLDRLSRESHDQAGETMVVNIGATKVIMGYNADHRDVRLTDGDTVVKVRLNEDGSIRDILKDDRFVSPE